VPVHGVGDARRREPLAALYERDAFLREGRIVFGQGRGALVAVLERLRVRYVEFAASDTFANVNTAADYAEFLRRL
jgi:molybdopterin-guanine dinucleotide biosynthesis protein A